MEEYKFNILNSSYQCLSVDEFNTLFSSFDPKNSENSLDGVISPCLIAPKQLYPENIIHSGTPFGGVARILYYGRSEVLMVKPSELTKTAKKKQQQRTNSLKSPKDNSSNWTFLNYLSVLSALYVGGFHRVYVHGDVVPTGEWWDRLDKENVTFRYVQDVETVFQNPVNVRAHQSDILRALILLKYGGIYQDKDILWTTPITEDLRRYPTVMCYDWPIYTEWPRSLNLGLMMAKRNAPFLKHFLESFWYHDDLSWAFNGILMPYKVYERHPETALIYTRLQVICFWSVCHPVWHSDYLRLFSEHMKPTTPFDLNETFAIHFTWPKPDPSLLTFDTIRNGTNNAAILGQRLLSALEKAGRRNLLD